MGLPNGQWKRATVADDVENVVKWADEIYGPDEDLVYADAFEWLASVEPDTIQAVVTDPPYGLVEYRDDQLAKRDAGSGGIWRIPPGYDGASRSPVPLFYGSHSARRKELASIFRPPCRCTVPGTGAWCPRFHRHHPVAIAPGVLSAAGSRVREASGNSAHRKRRFAAGIDLKGHTRSFQTCP